MEGEKTNLSLPSTSEWPPAPSTCSCPPSQEHTPGVEPESCHLAPSHPSTPSGVPGSNTCFVSGFSSYKSCVSAAELFTRGREHAQRNSGVQGRASWSAVPSKNGVSDPTPANRSSHGCAISLEGTLGGRT